MTPFIELDETGVFVIGAGYAGALAEGDVAVTGDPFRFLNHYYEGGVLAPRPLAPVPERISGGWAVAGLAAGTRVEIYDLLSGDVLLSFAAQEDGGRIEFALPDAGGYQVNVDAPDPYVDTSTNLAVKDADTE